MPIWKSNLIVCWFGIFIASVEMSQIAPVLPLYIKHLGVDNAALIAQFTGLAFGITLLYSGLMVLFQWTILQTKLLLLQVLP